jgi:hypothetical protein
VIKEKSWKQLHTVAMESRLRIWGKCFKKMEGDKNTGKLDNNCTSEENIRS